MLEKVQYLQQASSGKIILVIGGASRFFKARGAACLRAGLPEDAMSSPKWTLKQLTRLFNPNDPLKEMHGGWKVMKEPPPAVRDAETSKCPVSLSASARAPICLSF